MVNARPRLNTARIHSRQENVSGENSFILKTVRQLIVCGIIAAVVFTIARIETPECKFIVNSVENTLLYTVDYKATTITLLENVKNTAKMFIKEDVPTENATEENADAEIN